jgi:hypothetical protein
MQILDETSQVIEYSHRLEEKSGNLKQQPGNCGRPIPVLRKWTG